MQNEDDRRDVDGSDANTPAAAETTNPDPETLDPDRDDADRNAAGGGWEGANEVIENDFESEQLRRR